MERSENPDKTVLHNRNRFPTWERNGDQGLAEIVERQLDERLVAIRSIFPEGPYSNRTLKDAFDRMLSPAQRVVFISGESVVGKTRIVGEAEHYRAYRWNSSSLGLVGTATYEKDGEQRAIDEGRVILLDTLATQPKDTLHFQREPAFTESGAVLLLNRKKHWPNEALYEASDALSLTLREYLDVYPMIITEAPVNTAAIWPREGRYLKVARDLGHRTGRSLNRRQGVFADVPRAVEVDFINLYGGPYLRLIMPWIRHAMQNAQTIEEAQAVASLFGQPGPQTEHQFVALKNHGATIEQIEYNQTRKKLLIDRFQRDGLIEAVPMEMIKYIYKQRIEEAAELIGKSKDEIAEVYAYSHNSAVFDQRMYEVDIGIGPNEMDRVFSGLNDPNGAQLGIKDIAAVRLVVAQAKEDYARKAA